VYDSQLLISLTITDTIHSSVVSVGEEEDRQIERGLYLALTSDLLIASMVVASMTTLLISFVGSLKEDRVAVIHSICYS
jgi:hypothetical protein